MRFIEAAIQGVASGIVFILFVLAVDYIRARRARGKAFKH